MLSAEELDRVRVVLVRARNPANIGAVARAMHDFGFRHLRVVNDFAAPFEAARSAVDASAVIARAVRYDTVAEAVGDCTLVLGTTAVGERDLEHAVVTLAEAGPRIRAELRRVGIRPDETARYGAHHHGANNTRTLEGEAELEQPTSRNPDIERTRVAMVFGSEKTGLSNEELSHCNWLVTIPMQQYAGIRHPSMNLGQAVAVCLYELVRETAAVDQGPLPETPGQIHQPVNAATLERMSILLLEVMEKTGYMRRHAANSSPEQVRRLVRRMGASTLDAPVWTGFLRQVLWKLGSED